MSPLDMTYLIGGLSSIVIFFVLLLVYDRRRKPEAPYKPGETSVRRDYGIGPVAKGDERGQDQE